jgi:hypothetical protein
MEKSSCENYLRDKNVFPDEKIHTIVFKLLRADPDKGANCEWIINSFLANQFKIDEDEERVKEDILKYKELFGRRHFPAKGYSEMKVMIREKLDKDTKKSIAKSQSKTSKTVFTDCKSFYKNVKNTLPEPYKSYSKEQSDALFDRIQNANPSGDFQVCIWMVEEIKRGDIKEEELNEVKKYLSRYLKLELPLPNFYPNFPTYSNYQLVKDTINKNVDLLFTGEEGILLIPQTQEASCYYGAQTSWCTAQRNKKNMFEYYAKKGNIYIWFDKKLKDKFQFHFEESQFMDRDDNKISKERIAEFRKHPVLSVIFNEVEERFLNHPDPKKVGAYALDVLQDRWEKAEPYIMKDPKYAAEYAVKILKRRWEEAEPYIMKDPKYAAEYALDVLQDRWEEAEPYIMKDPEYAAEYALNILKRRWEEAEPYIMKDPEYAAEYAVKILKRRWEEAEPYIIKKPRAAAEYARIKGRWPEAEPYIVKNTRAALEYARDVIGGRWPEAEPYIMKSPIIAMRYARDIIKGRWPEAENVILNSDDITINEYKKLFFK